MATIPYPGYTTSKPLIEPISSMYKELGDQDACVQLQELSAAHLEACAAKANEPVNDFLKELYFAKGIPHGTYNFEQMRAIAHNSYLLVTYSLFEKMIKGCIRVYRGNNPEIDGKWIDKIDGEQLPPLLRLIHNLPQPYKSQLSSPPEFRLLEYYRLVRISGAHVDTKTLAKAEKAFSALDASDIAHFNGFPLISGAPNKPDSITFEDFKLFTRSIKYYSNLLNEVCG